MFKTIRKVSVPTYQLEVGVVSVLRFVTPFVQAPAREEDNGMKAPMVARVIPFTDKGEELGEHVLVGGTVLISNLEESYPDTAYAGRMFAITKIPHKRKEEGSKGRREYFSYLIDEVELARRADAKATG